MATSPTSTAPPLEAPLPHQVLSELYSRMVQARALAKKNRTAQKASEAVLAATLQNVEPEDQLVSAGPHPVLASLACTYPDHQLVVAGPETAASLATGLALAAKNSHNSGLVVALLPSRHTRGAMWQQATDFAAEHRLPIVFVADGTEGRPSRNHDGRELSHWPFPTIAVDGRDVIAVYRVAKEAISAARRGHGPTLVDCVNFVAPGRRGRDDRDPIASFRGYLKRHGAWTSELESYRG